ncbi:MAG: biotin/lipoyl-binding protein [Planctomycetia bacterium]|nr:biotin/lipoyl-binding protein [Planctomycetia bacterium]
MTENTETPIYKPQNSSRSIPGFLFRVGISLTILAVCTGGAILLGKPDAPAQRVGKNIIIPVVQVETVQKQENGLTFTVDGTVVPFREVPLASEVSGRVSFLAENCRVGRYVRKGDILLKIDSRDYEFALAQAQQQATQAERQVAELDISIQNTKYELEIARQQLIVQQRELARVRELAKTSAISKTDLDTTILQELEKKNSIQTLENQVRTLESQRERLGANQRLSEVEVEKAQLDLDRCTIISPLDGVVVELEAEEDKFVNRGESLVTVHDTSRLEVQASLYMKHVEWLWSARKNTTREVSLHENTNQKNISAKENTHEKRLEQEFLEEFSATGNLAGESHILGNTDISTENGQAPADPLNFYQFNPTEVTIIYKLGQTEYAWRGVLEYLDGPGLDSRTRMLPCRIVVNDPLDVTVENSSKHYLVERPALMPGMFVQVKVHVVPNKTLLNVSEMAIIPGGTLWKVIDGKLSRSQVTTAHVEDNERVLVYEDPGIINAGDQVVVSPLASPIEGAEVQVMK